MTAPNSNTFYLKWALAMLVRNTAKGTTRARLISKMPGQKMFSGKAQQKIPYLKLSMAVTLNLSIVVYLAVHTITCYFSLLPEIT